MSLHPSRLQVFFFFLHFFFILSLPSLFFFFLFVSDPCPCSQHFRSLVFFFFLPFPSLFPPGHTLFPNFLFYSLFFFSYLLLWLRPVLWSPRRFDFLLSWGPSPAYTDFPLVEDLWKDLVFVLSHLSPRPFFSRPPSLNQPYSGFFFRRLFVVVCSTTSLPRIRLAFQLLTFSTVLVVHDVFSVH